MKLYVKLYPKTLESEYYQGDLRKLVEEIANAGIQGVISPAFEGRQRYYSTSDEGTSSLWDLRQLAEELRKASIELIPLFPVFHDPDSFERDPHLRPVGRDSFSYTPRAWYRPICPSSEGYRTYRLSLIEEALALLKPVATVLDFVRYPLFWEAENLEEIGAGVPPYCYCFRCLALFREARGREDPLGDLQGWIDTRAALITSFVQEVHRAVARVSSATRLLVSLLPMESGDYVDRLRSAVGQDVHRLEDSVQAFSPMLYHRLVGRGPSWVLQCVAELQGETSREILPGLFLVPLGEGDGVSEREIRELLEGLGALGVHTVSLFHWGAIRATAKG